MEKKGFETHIFAPTGDARALSIYSEPNWTGLGIMTTNSAYREVKQKRDDFDQPGIYILISDEETPTVYIGCGDRVSDRLGNHITNKTFWDYAICFVCTNGVLNTTSVKYLEHKLLKIAREAAENGLCKIDNQTGSLRPTTTEQYRVTLDRFLENILQMLTTMRFNAFQKPLTREQIVKSAESSAGVVVGDSVLLHLNDRGTIASATAYDTAEGFIVCEGSQICPAVELCPNYILKRREDQMESGVLVPKDGTFIFSQDFSFGSPSAASSFILGRSSSGKREWKNDKGVALEKLRKQSVGIKEQEENEENEENEREPVDSP